MGTYHANPRGRGRILQKALIAGAAWCACAAVGAQLYTPDPEEFSFEVFAQPTALDSAGEDMNIQDGGILRSGDRLQFRYRTTRSHYVYLIARGSSGATVLLHPISGDSADARIEPGIEYVFPASGQYLPLDHIVGDELVFAVVSDTPVANLSRLRARMSETGGHTPAGSGEFTAFAQIGFKHISERPLVGLEHVIATKPGPLGNTERPVDGAEAVSVPAGSSESFSAEFKEILKVLDQRAPIVVTAVPAAPVSTKEVVTGQVEETPHEETPYEETGVLSAQGRILSRAIGERAQPAAGAESSAADE